MADISDREKATMEAKASGPMDYTSLSEHLQGQLDQAYAKQKRQTAYEPTASGNVQAIGDYTDRAPGEAPVDIAQQGLTVKEQLATSIGDTSGNILDILGQMMGLKKQAAADEQRLIDNKLAQDKFNLDLADKGLIVDDTTGDIRGMTDAEREESQAEVDPVVWLKSQPGGLKISRSESSVAGLKSTAQAIMEAGSIEEYIRQNPDAIYTEKEGTILQTKKDMMFDAKAALAMFDEGSAPGVGPMQGSKWVTWFLSEEGAKMRELVGGITNKKIKELSGAAVSDQEAQRLADNLPMKTDKDFVIKQKLESFVAAVEVGEEMKKRALIEGITQDDAYEAYGAQAYKDAGQEVPKWLVKVSESEITDDSGDFDVEAAKSAGYTQEEIDEYLKGNK